ncbi:MAG TPA: hypothetical protein VJ844_05505 [Mucilaginibacter sp.]|nr:hypothetical protein [Mucilaginibacter sp.]
MGSLPAGRQGPGETKNISVNGRMEGGHILYLGNDTQHHCLFVFGEEEVKG